MESKKEEFIYIKISPVLPTKILSLPVDPAGVSWGRCRGTERGELMPKSPAEVETSPRDCSELSPSH